MVSRQDIIKLLTLLLVASLLLVACERPLQNAGQTAEELATQVAQEAEQAGDGLEEEEATPEPAPEEEASEEETTPTESAPADTPTEAPAEETATEEAPDATEEVDQEESPRTGTGDEEEATETPEPEATEEGAGETGVEEPAAEETAEPEATEAAPEEVTEAETETDTEAETAEEEEATTQTQTEAGAVRTHVVQAGENLYRIGLQYGISWVVIADYNNISNPNSIFVGQQLRIPPDEGQAPPAPTPTPSPSTETTYIVKPGDNLYRIGRAFNISWVQIAEANGIVNPNQIVVGQELKIPAEAPGPTPQFTHTVRQGETLFTISLRYGVAWSTIAEANDLASPYVIYPGQTLVIPGG